jgi:hypothetical protein
MGVAWRAETSQGQIAPGTEFGIMPEAWVPGEQSTVPPVGARLVVRFPSGAPATVDLKEISDEAAIVQTSDGAKWRMQRVGAKELVYPPPVPSGALALFGS